MTTALHFVSDTTAITTPGGAVIAVRCGDAHVGVALAPTRGTDFHGTCPACAGPVKATVRVVEGQAKVINTIAHHDFLTQARIRKHSDLDGWVRFEG